MSSNKTKKVIKTKLTDKNGNMPQGKMAEKIVEGDCIFPFTYKGDTYNECFKGKNGDWCATKVNKEGKMKRMAYCDYGDNKATKKAGPSIQGRGNRNTLNIIPPNKPIKSVFKKIIKYLSLRLIIQ